MKEIRRTVINDDLRLEVEKVNVVGTILSSFNVERQFKEICSFVTGKGCDTEIIFQDDTQITYRGYDGRLYNYMLSDI